MTSRRLIYLTNAMVVLAALLCGALLYLLSPTTKEAATKISPNTADNVSARAAMGCENISVGGNMNGTAPDIFADPGLRTDLRIAGAFEPEATGSMGEAFDAACNELHCTSQPEVIRELIARLIIAAASRGELDPIRLRMVALAGFTIFRPRGLPAAATANATL